MAGYFTHLPLMEYPSIEDNGTTTLVLTNILSRSGFLQEIISNSEAYYEYSVKDGDSPEIIADKLYGDPNRFWIVLLFNKLNNPFYDFPLPLSELNTYIESKYGTSLATTQSTLHHYEQKVLWQSFFNNTLQSSEERVYTISALRQNPTTGIAETTPSLPAVGASIQVDSSSETFSNGITVTKTITNYAISQYDYEVSENEKRRNIKLLDKRYVIDVENEFRRLMRDGN